MKKGRNSSHVINLVAAGGEVGPSREARLDEEVVGTNGNGNLKH